MCLKLNIILYVNWGERHFSALVLISCGPVLWFEASILIRWCASCSSITGLVLLVQIKVNYICPKAGSLYMNISNGCELYSEHVLRPVWPSSEKSPLRILLLNVWGMGEIWLFIMPIERVATTHALNSDTIGTPMCSSESTWELPGTKLVQKLIGL